MKLEPPCPHVASNKGSSKRKITGTPPTVHLSSSLTFVCQEIKAIKLKTCGFHRRSSSFYIVLKQNFTDKIVTYKCRVM